jgi:hypothetical protein
MAAIDDEGNDFAGRQACEPAPATATSVLML